MSAYEDMDEYPIGDYLDDLFSEEEKKEMRKKAMEVVDSIDIAECMKQYYRYLELSSEYKEI